MTIKILLLFLLLGITLIASALRPENVMIATVDSPPTHFINIRPAVNSDYIHFKILLKQQNLDKLENLFWEVSNPKSHLYQNFLNKQQTDDIVAPSVEIVLSVAQWLIDHGIKKSEIDINSDYVAVSTNVGKASQLFGGSHFALYQSRRTEKTRIRLESPAFIPFAIHQHVDFIVGLADFIEDNKMTDSMKRMRTSVSDSTSSSISSSSSGSSTESVMVSPALLQKFYNIPAGTIGTNPKNLQSIAAFNDYYSADALSYFDEQFGIENSTVRIIQEGQDCINGGCDQMESNLDSQYLTSIGNNITTLFLSEPVGAWTLDWALDIQKQNPLPLVCSMSYSYAENQQCVFASDCATLGISSATYLARTNVEFQKIGIQGSSILVASGDDGSSSFYAASGNCPMDNTKYCPLGGCGYSSTNCSEIIITSPNNTVCIFPMGLESSGCISIMNSDQGYAIFQEFFQTQNGTCAAILDSDQLQMPHVFSQCQCSQITPFQSQGYTVTGYSYQASNGPVFSPDFPSSSPYVTSVGATQILVDNQEIVASCDTGAIVTSGGGFSNTQPQPYYQAAAVQQYLNSGAQGLPSTTLFNASGRAYPDITLVGHAYQIAYTLNSTSEFCPCAIAHVDGTSCSTPALSGMISLINDKLLNLGKKQLGFLNPLLYQAAAESPNVFNDITIGNNNCNLAYCCIYGYPATKGFDLASGIGSLNFAEFESYVLHM
ncbi:hypothetical protein CYY_010000 [Polysphondylium violaceum]|uniref:Peptidase S53 domain-containing protein n=1 Tax=Polysphondylium violaceum TaxID=133409 RepID=A0A8J4PKJ4_9MYCE|nr:hypothetical protein CYY_010000 [Polysphondylium violaceum]